jgi:hypothetical protein
MEERLKAPSIVPIALRASAHPRGLSASRTRRLATPDRATHHASSVTIWRDACAPFARALGFTQHLCEACERLRAPPLRLSRPLRLREGPPSPASAGSTVCSRPGHPSTACLATRREGRPRYVPTDFCFPLLRLRAPAPRRLPASLRSFHFALGPWACTQTQETGGPGVSRRRIRFGGPPGLLCGVILPHTPEPAVPLTPLSPPHSPSLRFRTSVVCWGRQDCASRPLREDEASHCNPRCLPSIGDTRAPARAETSPECGHVMGFRFDLVLGALSPAVAALRFRARLLATV